MFVSSSSLPPSQFLLLPSFLSSPLPFFLSFLPPISSLPPSSSPLLSSSFLSSLSSFFFPPGVCLLHELTHGTEWEQVDAGPSAGLGPDSEAEVDSEPGICDRTQCGGTELQTTGVCRARIRSSLGFQAGMTNWSGHWRRDGRPPSRPLQR